MLESNLILGSLGAFVGCFHVLLIDTTNAPAATYNKTCSDVFRDISIKVYDNNFDNYKKVMDMIEPFSNNANMQADYLIGLFEAMDAAHHLTNPLRAIPLYNVVKSLINKSSHLMDGFQESDLEKRYVMLGSAIIDRGSEVLKAGVIRNDYNHSNSMVQVLLNKLYLSNETLADLTISKMVGKVHQLLPFEQLLITAGNISTHVLQKIDVMLALYNAENPTGQQQILFFFQLADMLRDPMYNATVSAEKKRLVDNLMPVALKQFIGGEVCLNLKSVNGTKLFLQECTNSNRTCVYAYPHATRSAVLKVIYKWNPLVFNFLSKNYNLRPIHINPIEPTQDNGLKYDVYSSAHPKTTIDWQIELDGDYLKVHNGTQILCASNPLASIDSVRQTYTRSIDTYEQFAHECRWTVNNCRGM